MGLQATHRSTKTEWLYDLSREIWKGYTATRFLYFCGDRVAASPFQISVVERSYSHPFFRWDSQPPTEVRKPSGCVTFPERYGRAIQPLGFCTSVGTEWLYHFFTTDIWKVDTATRSPKNTTHKCKLLHRSLSYYHTTHKSKILHISLRYYT